MQHIKICKPCSFTGIGGPIECQACEIGIVKKQEDELRIVAATLYGIDENIKGDALIRASCTLKEYAALLEGRLEVPDASVG